MTCPSDQRLEQYTTLAMSHKTMAIAMRDYQDVHTHLTTDRCQKCMAKFTKIMSEKRGSQGGGQTN